jgi:hypothetical protein
MFMAIVDSSQRPILFEAIATPVAAGRANAARRAVEENSVGWWAEENCGAGRTGP